MHGSLEVFPQPPIFGDSAALAQMHKEVLLIHSVALLQVGSGSRRHRMNSWVLLE